MPLITHNIEETEVDIDEYVHIFNNGDDQGKTAVTFTVDNTEFGESDDETHDVTFWGSKENLRKMFEAAIQHIDGGSTTLP